VLFRIEKINKLIKQQLLELFFIDFPNEFITINFVFTKSDLSESKIFVSASSGHQTIYNKLNLLAGKYRKILAEKFYIRKMPRLIFEKDEMQGTVERIERILDKK